MLQAIVQTLVRRKKVKLRLAQYGISHDLASGKARVMKESDEIEFAGVFEPSLEGPRNPWSKPCL